MATSQPLRIVVGITTMGRRETLSNTLRQLALQSRLPERLIVCPARAEDCDEQVLRALPFPAEVVRAPVGLTNQRNAILAACGDADLIAFFDDDFYAQRDFLREAEALFLRRPDVVGATGRVLADGILSRGISHHEALALLARPCDAAEAAEHPVYNLYGCNMVMRLAPIRAENLTFDPRLPMYGWLEDVDFTRRLAAYGALVKYERMRGVHLAEKRGRTSGVRFGYSQVANPLYLMRKGSMAPRRALAMTARNMARNVQRFAFPEAWVDRRGRTRGNLLALLDLVRGNLNPERITELH
jgi:GT2 family glycosyltransferase